MAITEPGPEDKVARASGRWSWIFSLPLLVFPLVVYAAFAAIGVDFGAPRFPVTMPSSGVWQLTFGDILLAVALFLLLTEVLRSMRPGGHSIVDHALSIILFVICLILFLVWGGAATSTFFLLTVMALIDVIAGISVTIGAARRDRNRAEPA
jgi:hypothetical protein